MKQFPLIKPRSHMLARAHWYNTGLADSAQLGEGPSGQALPTRTHHHTNKRGHGPHTGATRSTAWLGRAAPGPGAQGGGRVRIPPAPGAIHLGYAGVYLPFLTPTPESCHLSILYFLYPFPYPSFVWTSLSGTLSTCNTFQPAANHGPCQQALPPLSLFCPG